MKTRHTLPWLLLLLTGSVLVADKPVEIHGGSGVVLPAPPPTEIRPVTDNIHGTTITDSYRWLEDGRSPATRAWIEAQMQYTQSYLSQIKMRPEIVKRLTELERLETYTIPRECQGVFFFSKRLADENQSSIYMRKGLHGSDERLVDATKLSADQNTSVTIGDVSKDGQLLAYGVRDGGVDEQAIHFLDVSQRQELRDVLPKARYFVSLDPGKGGLYYSKVEPSGTVLYYHRFGTSVESDPLVFGKKFKDETLGPLDLIAAQVTQNGRYLLIRVAHGVPATRIDTYAKDLRIPDAPVREMIHGINNQFEPVNYEDDLYVATDYKAEKYRVIKLDMKNPAPEHWQTVVPEGNDVISSISIVGGKLFVSGLHDVVTQTRVYSLDGKLLTELHYPALGSASPMVGREWSRNGFYTFEGFTVPPAIYHYDVESGVTEVFAQPKVSFSADQYEVRQVFVTSKDGTKVPMFIGAKKGRSRMKMHLPCYSHMGDSTSA